MEFLVLVFSSISLLSFSNSQFPQFLISNVSLPNVPLPNVSLPGNPLSNISLPGNPLSNISLPGNPLSNISLPGNPLSNITLPEIKFEDYDPRALIDKLPGYGKSWMYFPDGNGIPIIAQLEFNGIFPRLYSPTQNFVTFHLYTRLNPNTSQILEYGNKSTIASSNFNSFIPTKVVVHGWTSNYQSDTLQTIKDNFLEVDDYNVILVDWENIASNIIYPISAMETTNVGDVVGQMVDYLIDENEAKLEDFHFIGHSLGAHIAGRAGHAVKTGKIERVTGLDPALPGFEIIAPNDNKLDKSDAKFVDVIHTCGGVLGYYSKLGHADFYPNGGIPSQPGCFGLPQIKEGCSHARAWEYFAESIVEDGFTATQCDSWDKYKNGACSNKTRIPMGIKTPNDARGVFYLKTNDKAPYIKNIFEEIFDRAEPGVVEKVSKLLPVIG